jgi:transcriptional antiterminator NusG
MPDVVETAEVETAEVESRDVADASTEAPVPDIAIAEADTVEIEAVDVDGSEESSDADAPVEAPKPASPYDLPGDWYVIHSYSGYENKVKANLETRIQSMHMGDRIFEVHIPMEDVVEFKAGKKVTVPKKVFPGYILVRMTLDDDSWYAVRNTPGVTGFVAGNAQKPTPLSRREVERFLGVQEEEEKAKPRFKPEWEVGEQVRVVTGPFADFNGVIEDMNVDQQKVVVLVNIFGRDTPVELGFEDIQKS